MSTRQFLVAVLAIMFGADTGFAQPAREQGATPGTVQTVRVERRQLLAVTYYQAGVMVSTKIADDHGRPLESAEYLPGGNPDTKITSTYDQFGNEVGHAYYIHDDLLYRSIARFDSRNRKVELQSFNANGTRRDRFIYQYDRRGRQTALEEQSGGAMIRRSVTTFDRRGKELERVEYNSSGTYEGRYVNRYDNSGNLVSKIHYYTVDGKPRSSRSTYRHDRNGEVLQETLYLDGVLNETKTYKRDARGNPLEVIETDGQHRVVEKRAWSYEFDPQGNPVRAILSEWTAKAPDVKLQPTFEIRRIYGSVTTATFALWSAARDGDAARVAALLKQDADVNAHHPDGGTPLIKAATHGHREVVEALLAAGAKVDDKDAEGWTALMWSGEFGKLETVEVLLKAGADPNARNALGGVALMPAALNGQIEVLKLLLAKGANINAATDLGVTTLMLAASKENSAVLKFLIDNGADVHAKTKGGETALSIAVAEDKKEAVELLRKAGAQ